MTVRKDEDQLVFILCLKILVTISGLSEIEVHLNYLKNKKTVIKSRAFHILLKLVKIMHFFFKWKDRGCIGEDKKAQKIDRI